MERFEKKFAKQNLKGKIDEVATQITEELKETDVKKQAPVEAAAEVPSESVVAANPVADLPPLADRTMAIPEAIPVDESMVAKLDEAIKPEASQPQPETVREPAPVAEAATVDRQIVS